MNLMPREVEYTLARHPVHPSKLKLTKPCIDWYVLATSKNIFPMDPQLIEKAKQIDYDIFMLCHCVVDYSELKETSEMGPISLQGPNILSPMRSLCGGFTVEEKPCQCVID